MPSLRERSLHSPMSPPQIRWCSCRAQAAASLILGAFLMNPLILAAHDSPPLHQIAWDVAPGHSPVSMTPFAG
jgi:hypothetical protein